MQEIQSYFKKYDHIARNICISCISIYLPLLRSVRALSGGVNDIHLFDEVMVANG